MIGLIFVLGATSASITVTATVQQACTPTVVEQLQDDLVPQQDLYLTCNRGAVASVNMDGGENYLRQAGFGGPDGTYEFSRGGTVVIPLPRPHRGLFVSYPEVSHPGRVITIRF